MVPLGGGGGSEQKATQIFQIACAKAINGAIFSANGDLRSVVGQKLEEELPLSYVIYVNIFRSNFNSKMQIYK